MKSYTNIEQSKELSKILSTKSADMYYCYGMDIHTKKWDYDIVPTIIDASNQIDIGDVPCWSLATLLDILPDSTDIIKDKTDTENEKYMCTVGIKDDIISTFGNNPIDACYEMIIRLHKLNLL